MVNCLGLANKYIFGDQDIYGVKGTLLEFENNSPMLGVFYFDLKAPQGLMLHCFKEKVLVGLTREDSEDVKVSPQIQR